MTSAAPENRTSAVLPAVLTPTTVGGISLRNRAVVAPMSRVSADEQGVPTARMAKYYADFAAGGFGLVITEGIYTDRLFAQGYEGQPGLVTSEQRAGWARVVDQVHAEQAPVFAQLMHAGALSQSLDRTAAPSPVPPKGAKMPEYGGQGPYPLPSAMTIEQIEQATEGFVGAARAAQDAGFDGVEVHSANGYLLDQFITRYTNQRSDQYGGRSADRIRLTCEVLQAIREATKPDFVVGLRLSQTKVNDTDYRWDGRREAAVHFAATAEAGTSYIHVASEGRDWRTTATLTPGLTITQLARKVTGLPVIANGGMHDPAQAEEVIVAGHADLVSLATGALANPDWPHRILHRLPLHAFDHAILSPRANLENADRVRSASLKRQSA